MDNPLGFAREKNSSYAYDRDTTNTYRYQHDEPGWTCDEIERLLEQLQAVTDELFSRREDEELIEMIHTIKDRLLDEDKGKSQPTRHSRTEQHTLCATVEVGSDLRRGFR